MFLLEVIEVVDISPTEVCDLCPLLHYIMLDRINLTAPHKLLSLQIVYLSLQDAYLL